MSAHVLTDVPRTTTTATAERALRRLEQLTDDRAVDTLLTSFLARRRAMRKARHEQAAKRARQEHEQLVQRALLTAGLAHLR